jgi:hypothetical protein
MNLHCVHKDSDRTSQRTLSFVQKDHSVNTAKENDSCFCKDHKGQINRMCEQNTEILVLKLAVTILTTMRVTGLNTVATARFICFD